MKTVLVVESFLQGKGGVERVAADLANFLCSRGADVFILAKKSDISASYDVHDAVTILSYDTLDDFQERLKCLEPDLVHIFYYNRNLLYFLDRVNKIQGDFKITVQECTTPKRILTNWIKKTKLTIEDAIWERIYCLTRVNGIRFTRSEFISSIPSELRERVSVFSNGVDSHSYRAKWPEDERFKIIFVSAMKPNKNCWPFLKAVGRLIKNDEKISVEIFGHIPKFNEGDGSYPDQIYKYIDQEGMSARIKINGITDNIYQEMAKCHLHVITSEHENFSLSTLEAMSCGLPTIGLRECAGVRELLQYGGGHLIDSDSLEEAIEGNIMKILENRPLWEKLSKEALTESKQYSNEKAFDNWLIFFNDDVMSSGIEKDAANQEFFKHFNRCKVLL